jgi:FkbM family methyltransferase
MRHLDIAAALEAALAHHQAGRLDEAASLCREILAVDPRNGAALHLLGVLVYKRGDAAAAAPLIRAALEAGAESGEVWGNLGAVLSRVGQVEDSRAAFAQALSRSPNDPNVHVNLGLLEQRLGNLGAAIARWNIALTLDPNHPTALRNLELATREESLAGPRGIAAARTELDAIAAETGDRPFRPADLAPFYDQILGRLAKGFMVTYASNREDVLLARGFRGQAHGFWIDVGAHHPMHASTTCHFSRRGWTGVNIEPVESLYKALCAARPQDVNICAAVGASPGETVFYETPGSQLSTLDSALAELARKSGQPTVERRVAVTTLNAVFADHAVGRVVDFLKIDVEGWEAEVLAGIDLARWRPRVMVIESVRPLTDQPSWQAWEPGLLAHGYALAHFDGVNRFYVRDDEQVLRSSLSRPVTPIDGYIPVDTVRLAMILKMLDEDRL